MIEKYEQRTVREAAILTTSYVAGTVVKRDNSHLSENKQHIENFDQLILLVEFTIGSLTDARIKVEFSSDGTTYYQESYGSTSAGVRTVRVLESKLTASGNYRIPIDIKDRFIRISAKGTGTVTGSSLAISAVLGKSN